MQFNHFKRIMQDWYQDCVQHDQLQSDRLLRWRNIEPAAGQFLLQWIRASHSKNVLELGTSNGFSSAWLAYALALNAGQLCTVEIERTRIHLAQQRLKNLSLNNIDYLHADAVDVLASAQPKTFDLIFLDAERCFYQDYVADLKRLLLAQSGTSLIVDNVISHAAELTEFLPQFTTDTRFICCTLEIGSGLFIATSL